MFLNLVWSIPSPTPLEKFLFWKGTTSWAWIVSSEMLYNILLFSLIFLDYTRSIWNVPSKCLVKWRLITNLSGKSWNYPVPCGTNPWTCNWCTQNENWCQSWNCLKIILSKTVQQWWTSRQTNNNDSEWVGSDLRPWLRA